MTTRKRKLDVPESNNNPTQPSRKRRKHSKKTKTKTKSKDDVVEAYKISDVAHLKVSELKELLKKHHFPVSGTKPTLIARLMNPKQTIKGMKLSYHKQTANRGNTYYYATK
eukprot:256644_1